MQHTTINHPKPPAATQISALLIASVLPLCAPASADGVDFDKRIAPIFIDNCLDCHSGREAKGSLNLTSMDTTFKGGESGAAVVRGNLKDSQLWQRVSHNEMPPKKPLSGDEKQLLKVWIESGAKWGTDPIDPFRQTTSGRAGYDWWALQPVKSTAFPKQHQNESHNPIDAFVLRKLEDAGLKPSSQANSREIIRRLYFDLIGLPPAPDAVTEFMTAHKSNSEAAVNNLVDELLASKHFGERWARHWLDVVRFGESQGFERDKLRTNSWHYRDWVINAFNADMPYDEFVRQQLAGDVLYPNDADAITATGFLVAGPWDEVGQSQRSVAMKAVVRQDELEDYVGTICQTFLGLTVNCARCHDHKFDPIRQSEYYQLASALSGVRHGSRFVISNRDKAEWGRLARKIRKIEDAVAEIDASVRNRLLRSRGDSSPDLSPPVAPIARWEFQSGTNDSIGSLHADKNDKVTVVDGRLVLDRKTGYAKTANQSFVLGEKTLEAWVKLDNLKQRGGAAISVHTNDGKFDAIVFGERQPGKWMAGSDFFRRTKDLIAPLEESAANEFVHVAISYSNDGTIACYRNGRPYGESYDSGGLYRFKTDSWYVTFGLRTGGPNAQRQLQGLLETAQLYDRALTPEEVLASFQTEKTAIHHDDVIAGLSPKEKSRRRELTDSIVELKQQQTQHMPHSIYAVSPKNADVTHVLHRGNPASKGEIVVPGGVVAVSGSDAVFGLSADATDDDRRKALATWITGKQNPLFARTIVNRLWHYHFGAGIVSTPNDFGFNGARPSHPELLDWLAVELVESNWSLKHIHRLIVTSDTYLQASRHRKDGASIDANNTLLWRRNPQRLEAEALRDAILAVSGQLNRQYGGAPYRDFETHTHNTQFYTMIDADTPDVYRRTVYRTWVRSGRNPFLDSFDCPDPSTTAPKRAVTTTPIQSLALMNNSFVLRMADRFADRVSKDVGDDVHQQVQRVFKLAYGRIPKPDEAEELATFVRSHGLPALCRVILNSNEFIHVD